MVKSNHLSKEIRISRWQDRKCIAITCQGMSLMIHADLLRHPTIHARRPCTLEERIDNAPEVTFFVWICYLLVSNGKIHFLHEKWHVKNGDLLWRITTFSRRPYSPVYPLIFKISSLYLLFRESHRQEKCFWHYYSLISEIAFLFFSSRTPQQTQDTRTGKHSIFSQPAWIE